MKNPLLLICATIILLANNLTAKTQTHEFISDKFNCSYETERGRLQGKYISYYPNGIKKAEGIFENNYRSGNWKLWDSTGILKMQRYYRNPFEYDILLPDESADLPVNLLVPPIYTLRYNNENYYENFIVDESMIIWAKRIWRWIPMENNELLFQNNVMFNTLNNNVLNGNIKAYNSVNDIFNKELNITDIDTANLQIIAFKIKEDHFFDNKRFVSESRILGICPVAFNAISKDTIDLYWVPFSATRKYLAASVMPQHSEKESINSLDDLFFFRNFNSSIYKEANIYNRTIADYKSGPDIVKEAEKIEINLIESEHALWLSF